MHHQRLLLLFAVHNLKCEVCGAQFETRRGLSSHARSHLRQLGISVSESSGAPIDLLYQIAKERNADSQISSSLLEPLSAKNPSPPAPQKDEDLEDMDLDEKPIPLSILAKAAKAVPPSSSSTPTPSPGVSPAPPHSGSPSSLVRKAPISSLLPVSSPLRSLEHKAGGMKSLTSNPSAPATVAAAKPLWAPQENDAPLNLSKCQCPHVRTYIWQPFKKGYLLKCCHFFFMCSSGGGPQQGHCVSAVWSLV